MNKNGIIDCKIEFEDIPILKLKTKKVSDLNEAMEEIKKKLS